ncbi:DUF551 domain-containing protein [Enterobacter hormaechei]|uniref:DUF551 domain-containing protein n=1 Tax=Enterobacter hormaechei TaxID=158836 RepID=UPI001D06DF3B|nr:DUF551 domain-containing protein [Enterobacter hormaechei]MCU2664100.1 DUF551 domain-containing protein [Enterobacter hormaechei subsp. steigerwaltii]MCO6028072.1 DUF551 domain-containing protein [Enterobacter hormaechei]MCO7377620.1 DUF551 domain-containing protein [Enterobacter hormaechei]MCU3321198.1 DUF551 domain-containing protein [Enterobacter hormaechei subsp. steigerwaltii]MEC6074187.1 DUF551 domain-containing protein [Enterobacter hormaechei]
MSTLTKEWLLKTIAELEEEHDATPGAVNEDAANALAAMKLALVSLEAEAVGEVVLGEYDDCGCHPDAKVVCIAADGQADWENFKDGTRLYTAPPAPVSVPAAMEMDDDFDSASEHGKAVGWNAYRAAMLQSFGNSEQLNSPVIPDGWIPVSERMPGSQEWVIVFAKWDNQQVLCWDDVANRWTDFEDQSYYADMFTHWMPLPAAPQQEA